MRFIFKTDYAQDIKLAKHGGHVFWYSALVLLMVAAPWLFSEYLLAQLTFILIYGVVGLGLMVLAGFTGLFSLGHAAFLGVGAYTQAVFTGMGLPFPIALALAGMLSAAVGVVVGLPALRLKGIYLGIATLSFGFIVEEGFARWESVTGGNAGKSVGNVNMFGWAADSSTSFYFVASWSPSSAHWPWSTCCVRPPVGHLWPSATPKCRRKAWASTWPITRH